MSSSTDLDTRPDSDIAPISPEEAALIDAVRGEIDASDLLLPMLKVGQGLTAEVSDGAAKAGQFINSLTGEAKDGPIEVILVSYKRGRFYSPKGSQEAFVSFDAVAPDNWPPEYAGQHFVDLPDAEEQWTAAANADGGDWGEGPPIRTTYNYIGFEADDPELPFRLSVQRTSKKAAQKLNTLMKTASAPWSNVFELSARGTDNAKGKFYVLEVRRGRKATDDERSNAVKLATQLQQVDVRFHEGDEPEGRPADDIAPADTPEDALPVS